MSNRRPVGDILAEQRRSKGISIDDAVDATKLQRRVIEAFEYSDFDAMPPKGYARANLGTYARFLGLDTSEILGMYDEQARQHFGGDPTPGFEQRSDASPRRMPSRVQQTDRGSSDVRPRTSNASRRSSQSSARMERGRWGEEAQEPVRARAGYDRNYAFNRNTQQGRDAQVSSATRERASTLGTGRSYNPDTRGGLRASASHERGSGAGFDRRSASSMTRRDQAFERGATQAFGINDGYEGGSGGTSGRNAAGGRQSLTDVAYGLLQTILQDRKLLMIFAAVVIVVFASIIVVSISSCVASNTTKDGDSEPITVATVSNDGKSLQPIIDTTALAPSVDLNSIPVNSKLSVSLDKEVTSPIWIEASVDGAAVYGDLTNAGAYLEWTVGKTATVKLSSISHVIVSINGASVTPVLDNGIFVLSVSVPESQWVKESEPKSDDSKDDASDSAESSEATDSEQEAEDSDGGYSLDDDYPPDQGYWDANGEWVWY